MEKMPNCSNCLYGSIVGLTCPVYGHCGNAACLTLWKEKDTVLSNADMAKSLVIAAKEERERKEKEIQDKYTAKVYKDIFDAASHGMIGETFIPSCYHTYFSKDFIQSLVDRLRFDGFSVEIDNASYPTKIIVDWSEKEEEEGK